MPSLADGQASLMPQPMPPAENEQVLSWEQQHGRGEMRVGDGGTLINYELNMLSCCGYIMALGTVEVTPAEPCAVLSQWADN